MTSALGSVPAGVLVGAPVVGPPVTGTLVGEPVLKDPFAGPAVGLPKFGLAVGDLEGLTVTGLVKGGDGGGVGEPSL